MSAPTDDAVGRVAKELDRQRSWGGMAWVDAPRVSVPTDALRAVLARLAECEADKRRLASPVVAAFIAPNTSLWQGALVNVCADGSWWARPASLGEDAPWERQAVPLDHAMRGGANG